MARKRKFSNCGPVDTLAGYPQLMVRLSSDASKYMTKTLCPVNAWSDYYGAIGYTFTESGVFLIQQSMHFAKLYFAEANSGYRLGTFRENNFVELVGGQQYSAATMANQSVSQTPRNWLSNSLELDKYGNNSIFNNSAMVSALAGDVLKLQCYRDVNFGPTTENLFILKHERLNIFRIGE